MKGYFDANATTPLFPEARAALIEALDESWQNPSSPYRAAARVHAHLEEARARCGRLLNADPERVVFNSGATEGNRDVLAYWRRLAPPGGRIAVSAIEHPSVLENARHLWEDRLEILPVQPDGRVSPDAVDEAIARGAGLISLLAANNETGVVQHWQEIRERCHAKRVALHVDASQWFGREPLDGLAEVDFLTGCGHKFGGPKGVGFVVFSETFRGFSGQRGGSQENDHRAGTENFPAIAAMVAALAAVESRREATASNWQQGSDRFLDLIHAGIPGVRIWGHGAKRLANTLSLLMPTGDNARWVRLLDKQGFAVSTGSACATGKEGPSHVLAAMGASADEARRTLRLSALPACQMTDWEALAKAFIYVFETINKPEEGTQVIQL